MLNKVKHPLRPAGRATCLFKKILHCVQDDKFVSYTVTISHAKL
jgi:hypothetical protein